MADLGISGLKTEVDVKIYTNHQQAITGAIMNDTLIDTIDTLKNGGNLDAKSVDTAQLADGAVETLQINTGAVTEEKIDTGAVTEEKIGASAVTNTKIAAGAVTEAKIGAKAVTNTKIGDKAVDTAQLAVGAVEALQLNTAAVETAKIKDLNVTTSKLAAKAVTSEKLADDSMVRTFAGAVLLNPYSASLTPRRVGDIAINTKTGEIWQSTSVVNAAASWNRVSAGLYNGSQITDWNAINLSGDIASLGIATGAPTIFESFFYGHHFNSNGGTVSAYQIAIGVTTGKIYHRSKLNSTWGEWELQASASYVEAIKENVDSINVDNLGDVRAKSIDMDELPKVCSFPMYIISTTAPNVVPDFVSQHWIDTVAKKVYIAVGVSSSADFVALN